jgi:hypothetical protein
LATKQILSIIPIVDGQKSSHQFDIPSHESLHPSREHSETQHQPAGKNSDPDNLIDFDSRTPSPSTANSSSKGANGAEDLLSGPGQNFNKEVAYARDSAGLMAPLRPTLSEQRPLRRIDSNTSDVDEFVDAES